MGSKRPDNVPMVIWRGGCESVTQMHAQGWSVISKCPACGLQMVVRLGDQAILCGEDFSLWNRRPPCKRIGCSGRVMFMAKPPGCYQYRELAAEWPANRPPKGDTGYRGPRQ